MNILSALKILHICVCSILNSYLSIYYCCWLSFLWLELCCRSLRSEGRRAKGLFLYPLPAQRLQSSMNTTVKWFGEKNYNLQALKNPFLVSLDVFCVCCIWRNNLCTYLLYILIFQHSMWKLSLWCIFKVFFNNNKINRLFITKMLMKWYYTFKQIHAKQSVTEIIWKLLSPLQKWRADIPGSNLTPTVDGQEL